MKPRILQIALALCVLVVALPAFSTAQRTFVASNGNDGNPCSIPLPCRSFAAAVAQTSADGEVIVLNSAGYGPVTITQSVSVIAPPGVYAGISVFTGAGVTVAAGAGHRVTLRGITINGQGGNNGIRVTSGGEVHISDCAVANVNSVSISIEAGSRVHISHTVIRDSNSITVGGLLVAHPDAQVSVDDSQFVEIGMVAIEIYAGRLNANRIVVRNSSTAVAVHSSGDPLSVTIVNSVVADNGYGVSAHADGGPVSVKIVDSVLAGNLYGGLTGTSGVGGMLEMSVIRTTSTRNASDGFSVVGSVSPGAAIMFVSESASTANGGAGIKVSGSNATAIVSGSTLAGNLDADLYNVAGVLRTSGNNTLTGRGAADVVGTLTSNPLK